MVQPRGDSDYFELYHQLETFSDRKRSEKDRLDSLARIGFLMTLPRIANDPQIVADILTRIKEATDEWDPTQEINSNAICFCCLVSLPLTYDSLSEKQKKAQEILIFNTLNTSPSQEFKKFVLFELLVLYKNGIIGISDTQAEIIKSLRFRTLYSEHREIAQMADALLKLREANFSPFDTTPLTSDNFPRPVADRFRDINISDINRLKKQTEDRVARIEKTIQKEKTPTTRLNLIQKLAQGIREGEFGTYDCPALQHAVSICLNHTKVSFEPNPVMRRIVIETIANDLGNGVFSLNPDIQNKVIDGLLDFCMLNTQDHQFVAFVCLQSAFEKGNFCFSSDHLDRLASFVMENRNQDIATIAQSLYEGKVSAEKKSKTAPVPKPQL